MSLATDDDVAIETAKQEPKAKAKTKPKPKLNLTQELGLAYDKCKQLGNEETYLKAVMATLTGGKLVNDCDDEIKKKVLEQLKMIIDKGDKNE